MKFWLSFAAANRSRAFFLPSSASYVTLYLAALVAYAGLAPLAEAQSVGFSASTLGGLGTGTNQNKASKVTSLQFGPDNRLYFTQVNGIVIACDVTRTAANNYVASNVETIALVKDIPNYDDDGTRNVGITSRQATGILVVGTPANPVIYVSSSDPREGAGSGATDLNLDTNSGIISRLTKNTSGVWEKVDIVRGFPRSEENHASNGLQIDPSGTKLYLAQGGNTNAGSPSNNFAFASETALCAAVLSVDLVAIEALPIQTDAYGQRYIYDIPTVNDPNGVRGQSNFNSMVVWNAGGSAESSSPSGATAIQSFAAGSVHTLALRGNGTVIAGGSNASGQGTVPVGLTGVQAVAAGGSHSVALKTDGTVVAWGGNISGQTTIPGGLNGVQAIAAGGSHTVALKTNGTVVAWGSNTSGQTTIPGGLADVQAVAAGGAHTVALKTDGTVIAWGSNGSEQTNVPPGLTGVQAIAAGGSHTVALKSDGTVVAWGENGAGQTNVPLDLTGVQSIAAGASHTVALKSDGTVVLWGSIGSGQTTIPPGLSGVLAIAAGGELTLALRTGERDVNDPFGGNDGLNQARIVEGGPVQIHASGFRNPYDVLIAKTPGRAGKMYTFDNAANSGWGGYPKNEGLPANGSPSTATNEYVVGEAGTVNNQDNLHWITGAGYYGGHPNPIRANPAGAGWFHAEGTNKVFSLTPTTDWPPVPPSMADPREGDFRLPGAANGALFTNSASTTGLTEYTANNFGGAMIGNIITTQYSSNTVQRLIMNADGTQVTGSSVLLQGSAYGTPLDVTAPGPGAAPALAGTLFVGHHSSKITILEPTDFESGGGNVCSGALSYVLDEDNDGYNNADEILNGSDPCSPAVLPSDRDGDFISDLLDTDDDNDGIADTQDSFQIDELNGTNIAPPASFPFFNELGVGFFSIGFTGVMANPGQDYAELINDTDIIAGGTAGLFTDPSVGPGNPHGVANNQMNAFQLGVNVDEFTGPFRVRVGLGGLLFNGLPADAQSHGIYIGNGDQDNYLKLAVNANSGPGAIEIVHEENGVVLSQVLYNETGLFSGVVTLTFLVDPFAGTVQPGYSINDGPVINVGTPIAVGGKILDVIRGSSGMAVGLLATTGNASTPGFNATWDFFEILPVSGTAAAKLTVNSNAGSLTASSTNTTGSFQVENLSTGGQKITSVKVDLATAMLPDIVFDPLGTAGDTDGKAFQLDSFNGTGTPVGVFGAPHDGVGSEDGYEVLDIQFGPSTAFSPGDLLTFSADIDPTSTKGAEGPGPNHAASVSGLELIGATITVTFDDGTVRKIRNAGITGTSNTNKTSVGVMSPNNLPTPDLWVPGKSSPFATAAQPTVRVAGPAGTEAKVWVFNSALYIEDFEDPTKTVPNGGYDLDPFETNTVIGYGFITTTIGVNGYVDVPLTLSHSEVTGGINYVAAVLVDSSGKRSSSSDILVINYDPSSTTSNVVARINAGGPSYVDALSQTWSADYGFTSGSVSTFANEIVGTTDDTLYQTFRYDDSPSSPLDYSLAVPNGQYEVKLHFAETWSGITAAGQRVFDVLLEGQVKIDNLDVFAVAGANTAHVETLPTTVNDGQLTVGLRHVTQNPFICAIEVSYLGQGGGGPDTEEPSTPDYFAASNLKAGSLTLTWAASTDNILVTGYRLFRDGVELGTTTQLLYPQPGLTPSTEYDYEIEAYDAAGNISERSQITVNTPADEEPPTPPGSLKATAGNARAILTWAAATDDAGVVGYRVYRGAELVATLPELTYTDLDLVNGTLYHYEVVAYDASGKTSLPASIPVRPRALGPSELRVNSGGAEYTDVAGNVWAADYGFNTGSADAPSVPIAGTEDDSFYQSRRLDGASGAELKYTFALADGQYELRLHFAEVIASATVGYRVFDVKVENELALDNFDIFEEAGFATALVVPIPVTVTGGQITIEFLHVVQNPMIAGLEVFALEAPPPDVIPPTTPGSLVTTGQTSGTVSLSWAASSDDTGVTGYQILRDGNLVTTVNETVFTDTGLLPVTEYDYTVIAVDAAENASSPATVSATTLPDTQAPTTPLNLKVESGNASAALTWTASTDDVGVTGYRIYRDEDLVATVTEPSFTDSELENNEIYQYEVIAFDSAGNESAAATGSATPLAIGAAVLRVNVGDGQYVDSFGNTWVADTGYNTGVSEITSDAIQGTPDPEMYQSRRFDRSSGSELKYSFDLPNADYAVKLHFAEVWANGFVPGARVFDISIEGALAYDNFDIFARSGAKTALVVTSSTTVVDGKLNIDFQRVVQNPTLAGIEIFLLEGSGGPDVESPTAPGSLAASEITAGSVTLGWAASTDNVGVTGYRVYRDSVLLTTVNQLSFTDTGLIPGTEYDYSVTAIDLAGNVSTPSLVSATTLPDSIAPTIPGTLKATAGNASVALTWNASTDNVAVTGYRVYRDSVLVDTVSVPGFSDSGLINGTIYHYEVMAIDGVGNASAPALDSATPMALGPAVLRVNVGDGDYIDSFGNTWVSDFGSNTGYSEVTADEISGTPDPILHKSRRIDRPTGAELKYTFDLPNGDYAVRLHFAEVWVNGFVVGARVFDVSIEGALALDNFDIFATGGAKTAIFTTTPTTVSDGKLNIDFQRVVQNPTIAAIEVFAIGDLSGLDTESPTAPGVPVATNITASGLTLDWAASTDNVGVTGYRVYRDGGLLTTVSVPSITDTGLVPSTEYDYSVIAVDQAGNISTPALASATTLADIEAPTSPMDPAAVPGYTQVALSWTAATDNVGVAGYQIHRNGNLITTVPATAYIDIGLTGGTEYQYQIIAIDSANNVSGPAAITSTTLVDSEAPSAPTLLKGTAMNAAAGLSWTAATDNVAVTGYEIRRNGTLITTVAVNAFSESGLVNGTEYQYSVTARDASGNLSSPAQVTVKPRDVGAAVVRVNSGGLAYTDSANHAWLADERFNSGSTSTSSNPIAGTTDDTLYQTERYDGPGGADLEYAFDLPNGQYEVRLHFAETWTGAFNPGVRVFDVLLEGSLAVDNLDIFARAGGNTAYSLALPATVADGKLNIGFGREVQNPKICAIEVYEIPADPVQTFEDWLTAHSLTGQLTGDSDHGSLENLWEYYLQLDPNDPLDDLAFRPTLTPQAGGISVKFPELKPVGDYFLHASSDITDLANPANRIDTVTKAEIEAMEPASRDNYNILVPMGEDRMFFQIFTDFAND